ncbi:MAG: hypothetical protein U1G08_16750 [Verrucomicrobiota bacterium]
MDTKSKSKTKPSASSKQLVPKIRKGKYSDGHPLDELQYLECKLILNGDRFTSVDSFYEFAKLVKRAAEVSDVGFSRKGFKELRPSIREVLFLDTADFRLYNNAFILRRRQNYVDGFAVGDPEVVFKFRHTDLQRAAELDVRPKIAGDFRIKFKAEALPLKDRLGGIRMLFSHNAQFPLSAVRDHDPLAMASLVRMIPALETLKLSPDDRIELVNQTAVEEVLLDLGMLDFGKGIQAKGNVAVWRTRGDQKQLVGEFAFQAKMNRQSEFHAVAKLRCEQFFVALQQVAEQWLALGTTKTGAVYRLKGNPPTAHE